MPHPSIILDVVSCSAATFTSAPHAPKQKRIEAAIDTQNFTLEIERKAHKARLEAENLRRLVAQARRIRVICETTNQDYCGTVLMHRATLSSELRAELIAQLEECYFDAKLHAENLELHADYERELSY